VDVAPQNPPPKQRPGDPAPGQPGKPTPPTERKAKAKYSPWPWGPFRRVLVSVLVSGHLFAVFVAPWALGLRTQEPFYLPPRDAQGRTIPEDKLQPEQIRTATVIPRMAEALYRVFAPYNDLLYTNSGYEYFTPDPVWCHVLRYEVFDAANQKIAEGRMPDTHYQWPRLFYHRHMMLVDQTIEMPNSDYFVAARLLEKHNGQRIHMQLIRHHLLTPKEVLAGKKLDDLSTYEIIGELDQTRDRPRPPPLPAPRAEGGPSEVISVPGVAP
jgi:hypothetical protein